MNTSRAIMFARAIAAEGLRGTLELRDKYGTAVSIEISDLDVDDRDFMAKGGWRMDVEADGYTGEELQAMGPIIDEGERMLVRVCVP